jgi:hypothetical protein
MVDITYQDFDLSLDRAPGGFRATVRGSPAGCAAHDFQLPFSGVKLENYILRLSRVRRSGVRRVESADMLIAREFGGALFQTVFAGEVRACLRSSIDATRREEQGLRLRLRINDPELWSLPWEYLYYPARNQFLALSVHTPLVRYLELPEPIPALAIEPPLRVLVMIASPSDHPSLDVEREWQLLNDAVGTLHPTRRVVLERLSEPSLSALQRRLRRAEYHVFHFIGHGGYDHASDEGVLLFEDDAHKGDVVSSRHVGMLLHDHLPLRVAVLNACEGARASLVDPFAGSAQTLVQQGLPAVVAMQFEIGDEVATTFAQELYGALSDGYPVDAAVTESRKAIYASGHEVEWATPVLYMRAPDGRIFDVQVAAAAAPGVSVPDAVPVKALAFAAGRSAPATPGERVAPAEAPDPDRLAREALARADNLMATGHAMTAFELLDAYNPPHPQVTAQAQRLRARIDADIRDRQARDRLAREQLEAERRRLAELDTLDGVNRQKTRPPTPAAVVEHRVLGAARVIGRPLAAVLAIIVLSLLAIGLARWRLSTRPDPALVARATPVAPPAGDQSARPPTDVDSRDAQASEQERLARLALAQDRRESALAIAAAAQRSHPEHAGLGQFLSGLATQAIRDAVTARTAAEQAGRTARRSRPFAAGNRLFERAVRSQRDGRLADAISDYWSARAEFDKARAAR